MRHLLKSQSLCHQPFELLHPLPVLARPWVLTSLDYITELFINQEYNVEVIVDRSTKMAHFIPTKKTIMTKGTVDDLTIMSSNTMAYRKTSSLTGVHHGLLDDIISYYNIMWNRAFQAVFLRLYHPSNLIRGRSTKLRMLSL